MAKYRPYPPVKLSDRTWPERVISTPPQWCSVDLRDGNQALATPMNIDQKMKMFSLLVELGFKEIEIGFPSASQIEYDFLRSLIEKDLIPEDVTIQVLTQSRRHLIERTVQSLKGCKKAIIHLYNSTSEQQRRITFSMSQQEILDIAIAGTKTIIELLPELEGTEVTLQYSPESFTGTELPYALEVCQQVIQTWDPKLRGPVIINLPATVELSTPNIYADQIEWFSRNLDHREQIIISLHTHNDRGTGVAATELGLMAGAQRVEGTLFGNGERTGNVDIVTLALNLFSQGINPGLDFSNLPRVRQVYEECTQMDVHPRHPYAGDLVFTAFSGSHQDAISKGMALVEGKTEALGTQSKARSSWNQAFAENTPLWDVPYIPIDPKDIGRTYQAIIRINSQSGKGGVAYILEQEYGFRVPRAMQPELGAAANRVSDSLVRELTAEEIFTIFQEEFVNCRSPFSLKSYSLQRNGSHQVAFTGVLLQEGEDMRLQGLGNGPIDAFVHALKEAFGLSLSVAEYTEQAIGAGSGTEAAAFICLQTEHGDRIWGVGQDTDTSGANFAAILSAINRGIAAGNTAFSSL
ncbi:2-isopropylmalate synthase [Spirochaeta lutea]|uniref:2-isopropylmalate synthase n=1 Tax=Spirochaeta lutea TaxID=1480694 RepID=UPI00056B9B0F|nr:2-isopropylmalate synthase [Spirochaeta lutea]